MDILAQYGFGPADKISTGLKTHRIQGGIICPRYAKPDKAEEHLEEMHANGGSSFLDPEFYAIGHITHPDPNLGALEEWSYFEPPRKTRLISGVAIPDIIKNTVKLQDALGVSNCIAPNVFIRRADSIDTAIALNFLNQTKEQASQVTDRPVYGTISIHRDALLADNNFRDILDGLTGLDNPPDGYYIVVGSNEQQSSGNFVRSDLYDPEVIAGWMYMNYVLTLNGAKVVNGYCFLLSPLMGICGASACASGWSSGLRKFCLDRYIRQGKGGRRPNARYLSTSLLSYIRQTNFETYKEIVPEVVNGLATDAPYESGEPTQTEQAQQAWDGLSKLSQEFAGDVSEIESRLSEFSQFVVEAKIHWSFLQEAGFVEETEPNMERLDSILQGIALLKEWAELD